MTVVARISTQVPAKRCESVFLFQACYDQSRRPQTLAASSRLAHPGPKLPHCQTDPGAIPLRLSCPVLLALLFSLPLPVAQLALGPPAFDLPNIGFPFSLHTPLFFQPSPSTSSFLSITLHCSASIYSCTTHLGTTPQRLAQHCSIPRSARVLSSTSTLTTSTHPRIHEHRIAIASASCVPAPTTLLPLVADRHLSVPITGSFRRLSKPTQTIHPP